MTDKLPLALDPKNLNRLFAIDPMTGDPLPDPELQGLKSALGDAERAAGALLEFSKAMAADSTKPSSARALAIRTTALKKGETISAKLDAAIGRVESELSRLRSSIAAPSLSPSEMALTGEVRTRLASMTPESRSKVLGHAKSAGDLITLGAILTAPGFLSGLSDVEVEAQRVLYQREHHPKEYDRAGRLEKALQAAGRAGSSFVGLVESLASNADALAQELNAAQIAQAKEKLDAAD